MRYDRGTMNQVWIGLLIAGAAIAGLIVKRFVSSSSHGETIDVGAVSEGWLSEERAGKREDRFSS